MKIMKLSDFAGELVAENHFIKASFGGFQGSGKSRTASEFIVGVYKQLELTKPILIIDNERGSRFLQKFFHDHGIKTLVKNTVTLGDVLESFKFLESNEVDFVFVDSLTKVWYKYVRDYRANHKNRPMTLNDWGRVIPEWQERFSDRFVDVKGNIVFTGRGGFEYDLEEIEENGKTRKQFVRSGVKMKMQGETAFETDLNVWMESHEKVEGNIVTEQWRTAMVMKDRSATIDGKTFKNPTYKDFKPVIDFLVDVPVGDVKGSSNNENMAPSDAYDDNRAKREQALESINNSFSQLGLTNRKDDEKKLLIDLWEMLFLTNSRTKVESFKTSILLLCSDALKDYKNKIQILTEEGAKIDATRYKAELKSVIDLFKIHELLENS